MDRADRYFTLADQQEFARFSGDCNPMHLDPVAARRTQAGEPVVHGIHGLLWALDALAVDRGTMEGGLQVRFENFAYLDQPVVAVRIAGQSDSSIMLVSHGRRITSLSFPSVAPELPAECKVDAELREKPAERDLEQLAALAGAFPIAGSDAEALEAFRTLAGEIGTRRVRAIAALSTIVGMYAPGLHSIFSKCRLRCEDDGEGETMRYAVKRVNPLLRRVTLGFAGGGISGTIDAFVRLPPVKQPDYRDLAAAQPSTEWVGRRVLVVGGSRGLGEVAAKLLVARGAEVFATYRSGRAEAERLVADVAAGGGKLAIAAMDVADPDHDWLAQGRFTDLFYFASPPIFMRKTAAFSRERFDEFFAVYVAAFETIVRTMVAAGPLAIFWPSSVAIDEMARDMEEYILAKAAGETLCEYLSRNEPGVAITVRRLPRLATDQTSTVVPVKSEDAIGLFERILGEMAPG